MKDQDETRAIPLFPQRIRTYLAANVMLALLISVVLAVRTELTSGRYVLIDLFLVAFYSLVFASLMIGPFGVIEIYLYRRKKGAWYEWKNRTSLAATITRSARKSAGTG